MVSQLDHNHPLSLRSPSSTVSRISSSSRHRRQSRLHAGGSTYLPQNEFPVFSQTGDVEIMVAAGGRENRYILHRLILTQCSGFFEASTSQEWSKAREQREGELTRVQFSANELTSSNAQFKTRWRYELDIGSGSDDIPMLIQKGFSDVSPLGVNNNAAAVRNKPAALNPGFFCSVTNIPLSTSNVQRLSQADEDLLRDYDNLFRIFYNYSPSLDSVNIADAYIQCKTLLSLADMYDALPVVGPRIDHHLLQFQARLFKQVAKYPPSYLRLGYLARSKVIFTEALIHVVGQWPAGERHLRSTLPESVMNLIEDKVDDVAEMISCIEGKLFRLTLLTFLGERVTPANNYLDWLAVSLFRQWLADSTSPAMHVKPPSRQPRSTDGSSPLPYSNNLTGRAGGETRDASLLPQHTQLPLISRTYRALGSSLPNAYLGHDECKKFLKLTPDCYTRENLRKFERRLEELKGLAREAVQPLMKDGLQLQTGDVVGYLTCVRVGEGDFVWEAE